MTRSIVDIKLRSRQFRRVYFHKMIPSPLKIRGTRAMPGRFLFFFVWLLIAQSGCTVYHEKPLPPSAPAVGSASSDMAALKVEAAHIRHPILKPVRMDENKGLSPDEAAILAVLLNPGLKAERDKKGVSAAELYLAGILPNPQFSGTLDFPVAGSTQGAVTAYGLGLDYDIRSLITRGAETQAARFESASVSLDVAWQEWQVAEAAKLHAYRLYLLEKQLGVAKDEEKGLQENRDAIKQAVELGDLSIMDLSAAQASLEKVHLSVLGIEQNLEQERLSLLAAIGFEPDRPIHLRDTIELPRAAEIPPLKDLIGGIADRRLDLMALSIGYKSQEARVRAAILGQFPQITVGGSQAQDTGNVVTQGVSLAIGLPFFDRNQGQIAVERATRQQLFDEYTARFYEARSNITTIRADMESISRQVQATEAYLPTQTKLVATYYDAMLQGNADALTYYNARDDLISTHLSILDLQLQLIDRFMALEIASGEYLWQPQHRETPH